MVSAKVLQQPGMRTAVRLKSNVAEKRVSQQVQWRLTHHHEQCMCVYLGALLGPLFNAKLNFTSIFLLSVQGQTAKFKDCQYFWLYSISSCLNLQEVAANKHTHVYVQCSLASVGLTQAHPNKNTLHQYNFTTIIYPTTTHQHFPNCCCPYIFVVASNTTSNLPFHQPSLRHAM